MSIKLRGCIIVITIITLMIIRPSTSSANLCQADVNSDGSVNTQDLAMMRDETGRDDCAKIPCRADVNGDGRVNSKDILILKSELGRNNCLSSDREVPERETGTLHTEQDREFDTGGDEEKVQEEAPLYDTEKGEELEKETATPTSRFKDNGDGTVTDLGTALMWTKDANLPGDTLTFYQALDYIESMNEGKNLNFGYTDWRLPSLTELRSLIDFANYTQKGHELPTRHPFENVQSLSFSSWSAPRYLSASEYPLVFSIYCRLVGHNTSLCYGYIWPVRGGK